MKVGEYVRYKTLSREIKIGKVIDIIEPDNSNELSLKNYNVYDLDNNEATVDDYIIKSSPSIRDLIEENDLIHFEYYGIEATSNVYKSEKGVLILGEDEDGDEITLNDIEIKSIVTKEQFEAMAYKVGE